MFDADNDGYSDLYVCNGIYHDLINQDFIDFSASEIMQKMIATGKKEDMNVIIDKMPSIHVLNKMYRNRGDLRFDDVGADWGFQNPRFPMAPPMATSITTETWTWLSTTSTSPPSSTATSHRSASIPTSWLIS